MSEQKKFNLKDYNKLQIEEIERYRTEESKKAGANAVKIQTYTPDTITLNSDSSDFKISDGLWAGKTLHELYDWAHTPWDWHPALFDKARSVGITIFSSPFDKSAVDLLEDLNAPAYKIASFEVIDLPLIEYVAMTKKPMIISTGMANEVEIEEALETALSAGCNELALLHCVSSYPASSCDYNLATIPDMRSRFNQIVGLSDHTTNNITAITSIALGACLIEKHVTLDKNGGGADDSFSSTPDQLADLVANCEQAWLSVGEIDYAEKESEKSNIKFRRSLYFVENIEAGTIIQKHHIRSIRPGYGLPPKYFDEVLGKKLKENVVLGTRVAWNLFVD